MEAIGFLWQFSFTLPAHAWHLWSLGREYKAAFSQLGHLISISISENSCFEFRSSEQLGQQGISYRGDLQAIFSGAHGAPENTCYKARPLQSDESSQHMYRLWSLGVRKLSRRIIDYHCAHTGPKTTQGKVKRRENVH